MKIHNIRIVNFKSMYGEHYFDFDTLNGLVKLSGPIGSGKTTLGESLLCALFGKVKDHTNPNMVAWGTDTYELEVNLTSKGHDINVIRNPKKQLEVRVDGKLISATGKNDMQTVLEEFYDVPRMAVEKMCIVSFNAFNSIATMSPYETKNFLDDIFGFKTFTEYNDKVVIERKELQTKLTELNAVFNDTETQIRNLELKKQKRQEELSNSVDITGLDELRKTYVDEGLSKKSDLEQLQDELEEKTKTIDSNIRELEHKKTESATLGKVQKDNYNKFKTGKCPTCGHTIDETVINSYKQKMESYAADWKHYDSDIKKITSEKRELEMSYADKMNIIKQDISSLRTKISDIDNKTRTYNNNVKLINENYDDLINTYEAKKNELNRQISEYNKEIGEWNEMNDLFTKTLRYKLLDTLIPHINSSIQYYMNKFEQGYKIQFDQEFKAHVYSDNIDGEISYKDLSTGQRKTLDLAITFGILQNIISNVNFNVIFLDELMSNLDAESRNTIISVLNETLAENRTVFIINHAEISDDFFNHKIRVHLKNKSVQLTKKKLKKAVNTGDTDIVARTSTYEIIHFTNV